MFNAFFRRLQMSGCCHPSNGRHSNPTGYRKIDDWRQKETGGWILKEIGNSILKTDA